LLVLKVCAAKVGNLHIIDDIMNHKIYIEIFKKNLNVSALKLGIVDNYIFQHDNDSHGLQYKTIIILK